VLTEAVGARRVSMTHAGVRRFLRDGRIVQREGQGSRETYSGVPCRNKQWERTGEV
jgi:hypothetical protein